MPWAFHPLLMSVRRCCIALVLEITVNPDIRIALIPETHPHTLAHLPLHTLALPRTPVPPGKIEDTLETVKAVIARIAVRALPIPSIRATHRTVGGRAILTQTPVTTRTLEVLAAMPQTITEAIGVLTEARAMILETSKDLQGPTGSILRYTGLHISNPWFASCRELCQRLFFVE